MQRACDSCATEYEAKRPSSRFCSERCRKRAQRGHIAAVKSLPGPVEGSQEPGSVFSAALRELEQADRVDSVAGQTVLALARRIDDGRDTGSAVASLSRELRAVLEVALAGVERVESPLDELRRKRLERLGA